MSLRNAAIVASKVLSRVDVAGAKREPEVAAGAGFRFRAGAAAGQYQRYEDEAP